MSEVFFIGDTHFGHQSILKFPGTAPWRPFNTIEEHDEELVRRWNAVVGKRDIVWHLGDFCFGRSKIALASELRGDKRLVLGNHDRYPVQDYLKYFSKVFGMVEYKGMLLTHCPVHPSMFERWRVNIHGHLHQNNMEQPGYVNLSCEQINLTPVPFDNIRALLERGRF